jgi:hypothetical protein
LMISMKRGELSKLWRRDLDFATMLDIVWKFSLLWTLFLIARTLHEINQKIDLFEAIDRVWK